MFPSLSSTVPKTVVAASLLSILLAGASGQFVDDDGSSHEQDIEAIAAQGITLGCNPPWNDRFCPDRPVSRGEMAAFLARALDLTPGEVDAFIDDDASVFEADINALALARITRGCNPPSGDRFCPYRSVSRGEMAAFMVRVLGLRPADVDYFSDDGHSAYESDINAIARAGITLGCSPPRYSRFCPEADVTRAQMASFLARALGLTDAGDPPSGDQPFEDPPATTSPDGDTSTKGLLWHAGHETGDISEWSFVAVSGNASASVSTERAHSGSMSNELRITEADGSGISPGVRMEKHRGLSGYGGAINLPDEAYYSVFYYFPHHVSQTGWFWNVFQWKKAFVTSSGAHSRHPVWVINVDGSSDGSMQFMLERLVDEENRYMASGGVEVRRSPMTIPTNQWVHLECLYKWSVAPEGRIRCWQDGSEIWDVQGVRTDMTYDYLMDPRQWTVNNYAANTNPPSHSLWIDDAAISLTRLGPDWR